MSELRDREAHAIIGGKAQGKSSLIKKLFSTYDLRTQKIVILNNTNPPAFQEYFLVESKEALEKKKWRGIIRYHNPAGCKASLDDICDLIAKGKLSNGAVVLDDCTKYIGANVKDNVKEILTDHRMRDLDLYFTTHALRFFPPFCRAMVSSVTTFKTGEVFESLSEMKALGYGNYPDLYNAWKEIEATPEVKNPKDFIQPYLTIETGV